MYLADFNSVFQVSVGLHLAYTFLPDLHDFFLRRVERDANAAARVAENPPQRADGSFLKLHVTHLRYLISDQRRQVNDRIYWMQPTATFVACFSVIVLIIAGARPRFEVNPWTTALLLIITLLPMPMFCLCSYVSHRAWLQRIASHRKEVQQEWTRLMLPVIEKVRRLTKQPAEPGA